MTRDVNTQALTQPGAKMREIIDLANSIDTTIMTILASRSGITNKDDQSRADTEALLQSMQVATLSIRSLSTAVIVSGCVGDFINFPRLPKELRDKIWGYALEGLRIVELYTTQRASSTFWEYPVQYLGVPNSSVSIRQRPHVLFHVSHEARKIAFKKKTLQLAWCAAPNMANSRFDPENDLICFPSHIVRNGDIDKIIWSQQASGLQQIAIDSRAWHHRHVVNILSSFRMLKELILIVHFRGCKRQLDAGNEARLKLSSTKAESTLKQFIHMGQYECQLDGSWNEIRRTYHQQWEKPKLVGVLLELDGERCCLGPNEF